mmetsp:Transcript_2894/g.5839  ORF Transcript_2894/g.5839 Transcript_2894/m.5839 type:complete len:201 (-) Transcript_2894:830-1432(-)
MSSLEFWSRDSCQLRLGRIRSKSGIQIPLCRVRIKIKAVYFSIMIQTRSHEDQQDLLGKTFVANVHVNLSYFVNKTTRQLGFLARLIKDNDKLLQFVAWGMPPSLNGGILSNSLHHQPFELVQCCRVSLFIVFSRQFTYSFVHQSATPTFSEQIFHSPLVRKTQYFISWSEGTGCCLIFGFWIRITELMVDKRCAIKLFR